MGFKIGKKSLITERGFTIVELLIVVVVIGILASIIVVAYNGIQKRAGTIAYTSAVDGIEKQIMTSVTLGTLSTEVASGEDGDGTQIIGDEDLGALTVAFARLLLVLGYMLSGGASMGVGYCVGDIADYPAIEGLGAGECLRLSVGGDAETSVINEEYSNELSQAGVTLPKNLPVVRKTSRSAFDGARVESVARGIWALPLNNYGVLLFWNPPDTSNCGRGENLGKLVSDAIDQQMEEEGGYETVIAGYIDEVRSDPEKLAEAERLYGAEWEAALRSVYDDIFNDESPEGACMLEVRYP